MKNIYRRLLSVSECPECEKGCEEWELRTITNTQVYASTWGVCSTCKLTWNIRDALFRYKEGGEGGLSTLAEFKRHTEAAQKLANSETLGEWIFKEWYE